LLMEQSLNGKYDVLRLSAVEKLSSISDLRYIAVNCTERQVLRLVLGKLNNNETLIDISASAKDSAMKLACTRKSGSKTWTEIFISASRDSQTLGDALGAVALFPSVQDDAKTAVVEACLAMIRNGDESRIPEMAELLEGYGDRSLAEDYLNCGQPDLDEAGRTWAHKRGYNIGTGQGSHRARWGSQP
jgi:hypothetical protein